MSGLLPALVVVGAWRVSYSLLGYGAEGSGVYLDPVRSPGAFLVALLQRMPALGASAFLSLPVEPWPFLRPGPLQLLVAVATLLVAALLAVFWRRLRADPLMGFWALGAALAMVPSCATFPHHRLLIVASVGVLAALSRWICHALDAQVRVDRAVAWALVGVHGLLAALIHPLHVGLVRSLGDVAETATRSSLENAAGGTLVVATAPDGLLCGQLPIFYAFSPGPHPARVRCLVVSGVAVQLIREDAHTVILEHPVAFFRRPLDTLFRSRELQLQEGSFVGLSDMRVEVLESGAEGGPRRLRFRFESELPSADQRWVYWTDGRYAPLELPPVGGRLVLPGSSLLDELTR